MLPAVGLSDGSGADGRELASSVGFAAVGGGCEYATDWVVPAYAGMTWVRCGNDVMGVRE